MGRKNSHSRGGGRRFGADWFALRPATHQHRLLNGTHGPALVKKSAHGRPDTIRPVARFRSNADPLALGNPEG
jgi:hypothetical protein